MESIIKKSVGSFNHIKQKLIPLFLQRKNQKNLLRKIILNKSLIFTHQRVHTESAAREKAITYISERDDTYQKAIAKVYDVTDEKFWAYLEKLKNYKQSNLIRIKKEFYKELCQ